MTKAARGRLRPAAKQLKVVARWNAAPQAPDLRSIYEIWRAVNRAAHFGRTSEIVLELIRPFRQQALVTEVIGEGYDYKNTFAGAQLTRLHGFDVTGMCLSESTSKEIQFKARAVFRKSTAEKGPVFLDAASPRTGAVRAYHMELVVLPIIDTLGVVTHFITAMPRVRTLMAALPDERGTYLAVSAGRN